MAKRRQTGIKMAKRRRKKGQWSTKHYIETKHWTTRTSLKPGGKLGYSGRVTVPAPLVTPVTL
jgi:hypothetical protein